MKAKRRYIWYIMTNFIDLFFHLILCRRKKIKISLRNTKRTSYPRGICCKKSERVRIPEDVYYQSMTTYQCTFYGERDSEENPKLLVGEVSMGDHKWHIAKPSYSYKKWFKLRLFRTFKLRAEN